MSSLPNDMTMGRAENLPPAVHVDATAILGIGTRTGTCQLSNPTGTLNTKKKMFLVWMSASWGDRCLGGTSPLRRRLTIRSSMDARERDHRAPSGEDERHAVVRSPTLERFGAPAPPAPPDMFTTARGRQVVRAQPPHPALRRRRGPNPGVDWPKKQGGSRRPVDFTTTGALPTCEEATAQVEEPTHVLVLGKQVDILVLTRRHRRLGACGAIPVQVRRAQPVRRLSATRLGGGAGHEI